MGYLFDEMGPADEFQQPPYGTNRIWVSFSGGQTSAKMCHQIYEQFSDTHEVIATFANTGQEHEETLRFVHQCDQHFGWNVVWIEAVVHHGQRKACTHKVVDYYTASRNGEPFEEVIKKYGLPNKGFFHCTRELKINAMNSYLKSIGWEKDSYTTCIGIRSDEIDRMNARRKEYKFWYPLVNARWTRGDVDAWWDQQPFKLGIENYMGNCVWCYKKSNKKLKRIATESPEWFDFPSRMESCYSTVGQKNGDPRKMFRGNLTSQDILEDAGVDRDGDELAGECEQGCEVFGQYYVKGD